MTTDYRRARRALKLGLTFSLALGCKGRIDTPEGLSGHGNARQSAREQSSDPSERAAFSGVRLRKRIESKAEPQNPSSAPVQAPRYQCTQPELRGTAQLSARRLTRDEYVKSVQSALGVDISRLPDVQAAAAQIPAETVGDITREFQNAHAQDHVAGILMTAQALAKIVATEGAARARVFGECARSEAVNRECAAAFLSAGARRILKRPLDTDRQNTLLAAFSDAGEGSAGLQLMLARLLQAPETVFHLALPRRICGDTDATVCQDETAHDGKVPVDAWTVAARISYALTGHGPDDALLDAAARDALRSPEQARPHALRLLESADARRQLEAILDAWLDLQTLPTPAQAVASAAAIDAADLSSEARRELIDYALYEVLDRNADAQTLMTAQVGFPRSQRMAKLYGVSKLATGDQPVTLPNGHRGLLLRVAPLLSGQLRTSPIMRGVYVRKRLLCDQLASPDFSVVQARTQALHEMDPKQLSSRQIAEQITAPDECMTCHTQINPLGFALEGFDAVGAARDTEVDFDLDGSALGRHPIDTHVTKANIEAGAPEQLADASELVMTLATSAKYKACIAERLYAYAQLRPTAAADDCALSEIESALRAGKSVKEAWLASVLNVDTFVRKTPETSP